MTSSSKSMAYVFFLLAKNLHVRSYRVTVPSKSLTVWLSSGKHISDGPRSGSTRVENFPPRICRQPQKCILTRGFVLIRHRLGRRGVAQHAVKARFVATEIGPELMSRTYTLMSDHLVYKCMYRYVDATLVKQFHQPILKKLVKDTY